MRLPVGPRNDPKSFHQELEEKPNPEDPNPPRLTELVEGAEEPEERLQEDHPRGPPELPPVLPARAAAAVVWRQISSASGTWDRRASTQAWLTGAGRVMASMP